VQFKSHDLRFMFRNSMMKTQTSLRLMLVAMLLVVLSAGAHGQYLIHTTGLFLDRISPENLDGVFLHQNDVFALIWKLDPQGLGGKDYRILDEDAEMGACYWVEARFESPRWHDDFSGIGGVRILWQDDRWALVRAHEGTFLKELPRIYHGQRIFFQKPHVRSESKPLYRKALSSTYRTSMVGAIIDSVNLQYLIRTVRHLSGESSFFRDDQEDSIMTRYSYSPEIRKARDYIGARLEEMGYDPVYHPFSLNTFYDVQFASDNRQKGWLTTQECIYGTDDGGGSWHVGHTCGEGVVYRSAFPVNQDTVYVVGDQGYIVKTTDGGITWERLYANLAQNLYSVFFLNGRVGWVCGNGGVICRTSNGGTTWNYQKSSTIRRLYDIYFLDDDTGYAVASGGTLIRTTDSGQTWELQASEADYTLYAIDFPSDRTGCAVGSRGTVVRTTDGGMSWMSVPMAVTDSFYDVDFLDEYLGVIVGSNGSCLKTTDGGETWLSAGNVTGKKLYGVDVVENGIAWAAGRGIVARSEDMSDTWHCQTESIPDMALYNVSATKTGFMYPNRHYIICAHYDAVSENPMVRAPGADDNASGTAAVLEAARVLSKYDFAYSLRFVLFAAEEQGLIGSAAYATEAASLNEQILGVINLDMIGYDSNYDGFFDIHSGSMEASQDIGEFVASNVSDWNLSLYPEVYDFGSIGASDHGSFWNVGYPGIMIIEDWSDHTPFYHSTGDLYSRLQGSYFLDLARLSIGSLACLAEVDLSVVEERVPQDFYLGNPYPNPFNPRTRVDYVIPYAGRITVDIYDTMGRHSMTLMNTRQNAGDHSIAWNGRLHDGTPAPSGVYFLRFRFERQSWMKKVVLLR